MPVSISDPVIDSAPKFVPASVSVSVCNSDSVSDLVRISDSESTTVSDQEGDVVTVSDLKGAGIPVSISISICDLSVVPQSHRACH